MKTRLILTSSALSVAFVALGAAVPLGIEGAALVAVAGVAAVANLALLAWLTQRATAELADGDAAVWSLALAGRLMLALPVFAVLTVLLSPLSVALALAAATLGAAAGALAQTPAPAVELR